MNKQLLEIVIFGFDLAFGGEVLWDFFCLFFKTSCIHYNITSCLSEGPATASQFSGYERASRNGAILLSELLCTKESHENNLAPL